MNLILGDCLDKMKGLGENSVDLMVTDPPYQLSEQGFMGKEWDRLPTVEVWKECLRVLKPGAFAFVMCCPRQDSLLEMMLRLREAGFEIGFSSIYWVYSSGFPKAMDVSKKVDKKAGKVGEVIGEAKHPTSVDRTGTKSPYQHESHLKSNYHIRKPSSEKANELSGSFSGFQPKPALEVIIVVMKSLDEKTYTEQAMKTGKGITWLGNCRVPYNNDNDNKRKGNMEKSITGNIYNFAKGGLIKSGKRDDCGRFPANLLVSDNVLDNGDISKSGKDAIRRKEGYFIEHGGLGKAGDVQTTYGDSGGFSRYFSLDAWWENRIKELPEKVRQTFPFLIVSKPSTAEKNKGLNGKGNIYNRKCLRCGKWERNQGIDPEKYTCYCEEPEWEKPTGNIHVSVKPLKLMSYLVTLGSREGDVVLDPFMGSGTTGIACKILKREFIGIEKEKDYFELAEKRIKATESVLV